MSGWGGCLHGMYIVLVLECLVLSWGWNSFGLLLTLIVGSCTAWSGIRGSNDPVASASDFAFMTWKFGSYYDFSS